MGQYLIELDTPDGLRIWSADSNQSLSELVSDPSSPVLRAARAFIRPFLTLVDGEFSVSSLADAQQALVDSLHIIRIDCDPTGFHGLHSHIQWPEARVPGGKVFTYGMADSTVGTVDAA